MGALSPLPADTRRGLAVGAVRAARLRSRCSAAVLGVLLNAFVPAPAAAQELLPAGPFRALDGRLLLSGDVVATAGASDHQAYFNYTDYERNALRMIRLAVSAAWRPAERVAFVAEVRSEDFDGIRPYAAYVRLRPWTTRRFDIQAGRIPPAFGAFGRRTYGADNPLPGYPLAYQYLTSLRRDAVPGTPDDLLVMRGRGWQASYPAGNLTPAPGLPLVSAFRWDTGVQAHLEQDWFSMTGAVTAGTLSSPRVADDNGGKGVSGRIGLRPVTGLIAGVSAARGAWLSGDVVRLLPPGTGRRHAQTAAGVDLEYSRGHWLVRGETVWSRWDMPLAADGVQLPLGARAISIEGRYRLRPRIYVAARADDLAFSRITGTLFGGAPTSWDAPVSRVEIGGGYYLQRNVIARAAIQHNRRDGGRIRSRTFLAVQIAYWF